MAKRWARRALRALQPDWIQAALDSRESGPEKRLRECEAAEQRRSELLNGLTRRQRHFILEKLMGNCDRDAALLAGYSLSVAENTKQRVWKPVVRAEFERIQSELAK